MFLPHPRVKVSIVGSLRDREVACSASDRQGSIFEFCVWRTVSSQSSHHPQEVLLAQFSLYVHKGGLKPDSFHFNFSLQKLKLYNLALYIRANIRTCCKYHHGRFHCWLHSKQYSFFRGNPSVLLPCNPRRTLAGFSWGCMVIVLRVVFKETKLFRVYVKVCEWTVILITLALNLFIYLFICMQNNTATICTIKYTYIYKTNTNCIKA